MWNEREPDETLAVDVGGHRVATYSFGSGPDAVLCLAGGPGLPCDYLRAAHSFLAGHGLRVVTFDALGCGASDRPADPAFWSLEGSVRQIEAVRVALGLQQMVVLGHSWGGWLAIEYALTHPQAVRALVLENTAADLPHLGQELARLRLPLGEQTVTMMAAYEAAGEFDHPEYMAAITLLTYRHVCRLKRAPRPLERSLRAWNRAPYEAMRGPNTFLSTGTLKHWSRLADLHRIRVPVQIMVGRYDAHTPACAEKMRARLPHAELVIFEHSSHMPFYEEPKAFDDALLPFLRRVQAAAV
ncbi:proline iminopeptidase-family hydrolase [Pseudoxanthobacter sp.]|uniref:proline iminopeptidase-family hydrolase n=1 Tax=Pseudoxanthobacter sp. TaxID=1925742 RepID=UPI002FE16142